MTRRGRRALALAVWIAPAAVCLAATATVYLGFRIAPPDRLAAADRAWVMASLRAAFDQTPPPPATDAPALHRPIAGPLAVTVWSAGVSRAT